MWFTNHSRDSVWPRPSRLWCSTLQDRVTSPCELLGSKSTVRRSHSGTQLPCVSSEFDGRIVRSQSLYCQSGTRIKNSTEGDGGILGACSMESSSCENDSTALERWRNAGLALHRMLTRKSPCKQTRSGHRSRRRSKFKVEAHNSGECSNNKTPTTDVNSEMICKPKNSNPVNHSVSRSLYDVCSEQGNERECTDNLVHISFRQHLLSSSPELEKMFPKMLESLSNERNGIGVCHGLNNERSKNVKYQTTSFPVSGSCVNNNLTEPKNSNTDCRMSHSDSRTIARPSSLALVTHSDSPNHICLSENSHCVSNFIVNSYGNLEDAFHCSEVKSKDNECKNVKATKSHHSCVSHFPASCSRNSNNSTQTSPLISKLSETQMCSYVANEKPTKTEPVCSYSNKHKIKKSKLDSTYSPNYNTVNTHKSDQYSTNPNATKTESVCSKHSVTKTKPFCSCNVDQYPTMTVSDNINQYSIKTESLCSCTESQQTDSSSFKNTSNSLSGESCFFHDTNNLSLISYNTQENNVSTDYFSLPVDSCNCDQDRGCECSYSSQTSHDSSLFRNSMSALCCVGPEAIQDKFSSLQNQELSRNINNPGLCNGNSNDSFFNDCLFLQAGNRDVCNKCDNSNQSEVKPCSASGYVLSHRHVTDHDLKSAAVCKNCLLDESLDDLNCLHLVDEDDSDSLPVSRSGCKSNGLLTVDRRKNSAEINVLLNLDLSKDLASNKHFERFCFSNSDGGGGKGCNKEDVFQSEGDVSCNRKCLNYVRRGGVMANYLMEDTNSKQSRDNGLSDKSGTSKERFSCDDADSRNITATTKRTECNGLSENTSKMTEEEKSLSEEGQTSENSFSNNSGHENILSGAKMADKNVTDTNSKLPIDDILLGQFQTCKESFSNDNRHNVLSGSKMADKRLTESSSELDKEGDISLEKCQFSKELFSNNVKNLPEADSESTEDLEFSLEEYKTSKEALSDNSRMCTLLEDNNLPDTIPKPAECCNVLLAENEGEKEKPTFHRKWNGAGSLLDSEVNKSMNFCNELEDKSISLQTQSCTMLNERSQMSDGLLRLENKPRTNTGMNGQRGQSDVHNTDTQSSCDTEHNESQRNQSDVQNTDRHRLVCHNTDVLGERLHSNNTNICDTHSHVMTNSDQTNNHDLISYSSSVSHHFSDQSKSNVKKTHGQTTLINCTCKHAVFLHESDDADCDTSLSSSDCCHGYSSCHSLSCDNSHYKQHHVMSRIASTIRGRSETKRAGRRRLRKKSANLNRKATEMSSTSSCDMEHNGSISEDYNFGACSTNIDPLSSTRLHRYFEKDNYNNNEEMKKSQNSSGEFDKLFAIQSNTSPVKFGAGSLDLELSPLKDIFSNPSSPFNLVNSFTMTSCDTTSCLCKEQRADNSDEIGADVTEMAESGGSLGQLIDEIFSPFDALIGRKNSDSNKSSESDKVPEFFRAPDFSYPTSDSGDADDEFECDCQHCQFVRGSSHPDSVAGMLTGPNADMQQFSNPWESDWAASGDNNFDISIDDFRPLEPFLQGLQHLPQDPIELMYQNVIMQMLTVHPELLGELAPPPVSPTVIDSLKIVTATKDNTAPDLKCPICLCWFDEGEELTQLPCQHLYHPLCIQAWLVKSGTCPVCRHILQSEAQSVD